MGLALEVLSGSVTNPGATLTALSLANSADSLTVRAHLDQNPAWLANVWGLGATAGVIRLRSPRFHDFVQGIRLQRLAADATPLDPSQVDEMLYSQDAITVEATGGAAETDVVCLLVYYQDLPGIAARLVSPADISGRIVHLFGLEVDPTSSATIGAWGPGRALNADFDTFEPNTDYAVLGYEVATRCAAVAIRGADTGNLRVGGPGETNRLVTRDWFWRYAVETGRPCIPIINSANKASTLVDVVHNAASTAIGITFLLAQLA